MEKYEFLEHTADVKFRAYGRDLREAFENAGLAMFKVITDTSKVEKRVEKDLKLKAEDLKALLFDYLSELIFWHETEGLLFSEFKIKEIKEKDGGYQLAGKFFGEKLNENKHKLKTVVKAVTYNEMRVHQDKRCWVQVVLDV